MASKVESDVEVRYQGDAIDEIVMKVNGVVVFHLEYMDDSNIWFSMGADRNSLSVFNINPKRTRCHIVTTLADIGEARIDHA